MRIIRNFVREMREDPRTCILISIYLLGFLLAGVGTIILSVWNHYIPAYIVLSGCACWLFLICCGWTIRPSMNPFSGPCVFILCSIYLVIVIGLAIPFILILVSTYKVDNNADDADAHLTRFRLSSNNTLEYNLTVNVMFGHNTKKSGVYYEDFQAWASYQGCNFTSLSLPPFYLGETNNNTRNSSTSVLQTMVFEGRQDQVVLLPPEGLKRYKQDEVAGRFSIDVTLSYLGCRGKHRFKDVRKFAFKELALPSASSGWIEGGEQDPIRGDVDLDIVAISVACSFFLVFLCWWCCWCGVEDRSYGLRCLSCATFCFLIPLITLPIYIPDLIQSLKKMDQVDFNVSNATLTQFNLSSSTLIYNLSVDITVGPNHRRTGFYCDKVQAIVYYLGQNLTSLVLPSFYLQGRQRHGARTVILRPVFEGQQVMALLAGGDGLVKFHRETSANRYSLMVTLSYSGIRTNDDQTFSNEAGHQNQLSGVATFDLKGVCTFLFKELALPNASSGWVEGDENDSTREDVDSDIAAVSMVVIFLLATLSCCWCAVKNRRIDTACLAWATFCSLITLISLPFNIYNLSRSLKKMDHSDFHISNATLTHFNLSSSSSSSLSTLIFNFSAAVTIGPNWKKTGVYYDKLEATAYYQGQNLTSLVLSPVYLQGRQPKGARTVILRPVFQGQQVMTVLAGGKWLDEFRKETAANLFGIVVTLSYSGTRTDDYEYNYNNSYSSSIANQTLNKATRHHTFDFKVPLMAGASTSAAANVYYGFTRQHGINILLAFLVYGSLCF